jgi:hypothetical protein
MHFHKPVKTGDTRTMTPKSRLKLPPVERYTARRKAEFLLANAINRADYERARKEVQKLGIDPDSVLTHMAKTQNSRSR